MYYDVSVRVLRIKITGDPRRPLRAWVATGQVLQPRVAIIAPNPPNTIHASYPSLCQRERRQATIPDSVGLSHAQVAVSYPPNGTEIDSVTQRWM